MSKKKLLEFGLKEADAFQKNFKIIFDRLVRGYKSMMGKDPEGLDLLKVKMEAREKAINTTKVVNQKGLTLDPDKPIIGGTQEGIETIKIKELDDFNLSKDDPMGDLEKIVKGEGDTGLPKGQRPFGDNIRDAYSKAGRDRKDATEMIEALDSPGAKKSYEIMEESLGVRLYGDETFEELMQIKETGVHPRGEPPIKKADGGRIGFSQGGESIIGSDIGTIGGLMDAPTTEDDEFSDIAGQTAGLGVLSGLTKVFGSKIGTAIFNRGRKKTIDMATQKAIDTAKKIESERVAKEAARKAEISRIQQRLDRDRRGYDGSRGPSASPYGGGGGGLHSDYKADGGLITMFVEKR